MAPPGTEPGKLGINPRGDLRGPDGETVVGHVDKQTKLYVTTEDIVVLKSQASRIEDNWSMHEVGTSSKDGTPIPFLAEGGGTQYFTTAKPKPKLEPYTEPTVHEPTTAHESTGPEGKLPEAPAMAEDPSLNPDLKPPGEDQVPSGGDKVSEQSPSAARTPKERADALARQRGDLSERAQAAHRGDLRAEVEALRDDVETLQELAKERGEGLEDEFAEREQQLNELSQKIAEAEGKVSSKESSKEEETPTLDPKTDPARKFIEGQGGGTLKKVELPAGCGVSVDGLLERPPAQLRKLLATQPDDALRSALGLGNDVDISKTRDAIRTVVKVVEQAQRLTQKL